MPLTKKDFQALRRVYETRKRNRSVLMSRRNFHDDGVAFDRFVRRCKDLSPQYFSHYAILENSEDANGQFLAINVALTERGKQVASGGYFRYFVKGRMVRFIIWFSAIVVAAMAAFFIEHILRLFGKIL